jgi:TP901 family phage tail tape measure protein
MTDYNIQVKIDPQKAVANAKQVENSLGKVEAKADSMQKVLNRAFALVSVSAGVTAGIRVLANFSQEMSTVQAVTGATAAQFLQMKKVASDLGATTRFTATQAAEGMTYLARAGFNTQQVMATVDDALRLAQAGALDLGSAADIASNVLTGFRIDADDAARVIDVLALAANSSNTNVQQLGDAMKLVAPVAAGMKVSLEESTAAVSALSDAGLQATLAGTGLRRILSELEAPSVKTQKILRELGLTTSDVKISQVGLTKALETLAKAGVDTGLALEIFGDRGGPAFEVLSSGIPKVKALTEAYDKATGTAQKMADVMDNNLNGAMLAVRSAVEAVVLAFGELGGESTLTVFFRGLAVIIRGVANNLATITSVLMTGAAAWGTYFLAIKTESLIAAGTAAVKYITTIASGRAVVLGSAAAEAQKAAAILAGRQAEVDATRAAILRIETEISKAVVLQGSTTAEFARLAMMKQVAALETKLAAEETSLAAARLSSAAATNKASGIFTKFGSIFPGLTAGVKAFTAAIAANPIGAIAVALTIVIGLLFTFRDRIKLSSDSLATLGDLAAVTWEYIKTGLKAFLDYFKVGWEAIKDLVPGVFDDINFSVKGFLTYGAKAVDFTIGLYLGAYKSIVAGWKLFPVAMKDIVTSAMNGVISIVESGVNQLIRPINALFEAMDMAAPLAKITLAKWENTAAGGAEALGEAVAKGFREGYDTNFAQKGLDTLLTAAEVRAQKRIEEAKKAEQAAGVPKKKDAGLIDEINERKQLASAYDTVLKDLDKEIQLLKLDGDAREIATRVMQIEKDLKYDLIGSEKELVETRLQQVVALTKQSNLMESLNGPVKDYIDKQKTLNELIDAGRISQEQYNMALQQTSLAQSLQTVQEDLAPADSTLADNNALAEKLAERQDILRQAKEAELLTEQEYYALSIEAQTAYNDAVTQLEQTRYATMFASASSAFNTMAQATKDFAGEQSGLYRGLFAASKAFAIAESTVSIVQGIANAAKLMYPANLVAMATVAAQTAGLIGQIQAVSYTGEYQTGGDFKVGGAGGADSQLVAFRATPNETVSVRTPSQQQRDDRNNQPAPQEPPVVNVVNVPSPDMLEDYLNAPSGERTLVNVIRRNKASLGL